MASLAAVAFPQAAAAEAKDPGLTSKRLSALIELQQPRGLLSDFAKAAAASAR